MASTLAKRSPRPASSSAMALRVTAFGTFPSGGNRCSSATRSMSRRFASDTLKSIAASATAATACRQTTKITLSYTLSRRQGLPRYTAHGLRKATTRRGADFQMGNRSLTSLSGHTKDDEVARYKADANRSRLNDAAIKALSTREYSTLKSSGPNGLYQSSVTVTRGGVISAPG